jgi:hypothetical protein
VTKGGDANGPGPRGKPATASSEGPEAGSGDEPAAASSDRFEPASSDGPGPASSDEPASASGDQPASAAGDEPDGSASPLRALLAIAAAALGVWLARQFAASYALAASASSFAVVYLVVERAGVPWSSQALGSPRTRRVLARAALFGLAPALAAALVGWASGGLRWHPGALGLGLVASALREALEAAREETFARWMPWALARSRVPRAALVGFQVLASVAPLVAVAKPEAWALGAVLGLLCARLLEASRLWAAPVVAHATLRVASAVLVPLLFEVRWREGSWSPIENARGLPALWLTAALGLAAAALWAGARRADGSA